MCHSNLPCRLYLLPNSFRRRGYPSTMSYDLSGTSSHSLDITVQLPRYLFLESKLDTELSNVIGDRAMNFAI